MPLTRTALVTAAVALSVLTACSDDPDPSQAAPQVAITTSTPTTATASVSASPNPTTSPAQAEPSSTKVVLFGDDLGPAKVGNPFRQAVAALSLVLGKPTADPTEDVACAHADQEVTWRGDFRIAELDGKVAGWFSTSKALSSPSGVHVGTTVARLKRVYGAKLNIIPIEGSAVEFNVDGVSFAGALESKKDTARVTALYNGVCGSP